MLALIWSRVRISVSLGGCEWLHLTLYKVDKKEQYLTHTNLFIRSMQTTPHVTLEQWRALVAVVDSAGYAQAAEALHKSQSAVTYAVQKLERQLGVKAFDIEGRKAVLTPTGQLLYRRARALLEEASGVERAARTLSAGWEAEIRIAVEILFPTWLLLQSLDRFGTESPQTRIEVIESVLGGTGEALLQGQADLAISPQDPARVSRRSVDASASDSGGSSGSPVASTETQALDFARPAYCTGTSWCAIRGQRRSTGTLSVEVDKRWTVSNMTSSIQAVRMGYGFAWFPKKRFATISPQER
jgi:DNA-binding transcriptional LysR family regulator